MRLMRSVLLVSVVGGSLAFGARTTHATTTPALSPLAGLPILDLNFKGNVVQRFQAALTSAHMLQPRIRSLVHAKLPSYKYSWQQTYTGLECAGGTQNCIGLDNSLVAPASLMLLLQAGGTNGIGGAPAIAFGVCAQLTPAGEGNVQVKIGAQFGGPALSPQFASGGTVGILNGDPYSTAATGYNINSFTGGVFPVGNTAFSSRMVVNGSNVTDNSAQVFTSGNSAMTITGEVATTSSLLKSGGISFSPGTISCGVDASAVVMGAAQNVLVNNEIVPTAPNS